jgi:hypothetical protein
LKSTAETTCTCGGHFYRFKERCWYAKTDRGLVPIFSHLPACTSGRGPNAPSLFNLPTKEPK